VLRGSLAGTIDAFMGASYYWVAKDPAVQWFATVPFGMNAEAMAAWYRQGGAQVVKEESEKSPMAAKVYASYTKFQAQHTGWSRVSEGAYQQFVAL
jgi:TRAP-type mannitol/chloroaromatic compound transport system substrate-binding protein